MYNGKVDTGESPLDPNHSHFFLVDNGTQHKYGGEIEFRAKLEKALSENYTDDGVYKARCKLQDLMRSDAT